MANVTQKIDLEPIVISILKKLKEENAIFRTAGQIVEELDDAGVDGEDLYEELSKVLTKLIKEGRVKITVEVGMDFWTDLDFELV